MLLDLLPIKKRKSVAIALCTGALSFFVYQLFTNHQAQGQKVSIEENNLYHANNYTIVKTKMGDDLYVPRISLIKSVPVFNVQLCSSVTYTYTIKNEGGPGEELEDIVLTDLDFGGTGIIASDPGDFSGDNGNDILDVGETWTVQVVHNHSQNDIENGQIGEQPASVNAKLVSNNSIEVNDDSHPSDPNADGPTLVDLSSCQNASIGLIMGWQYIDLDADACYENYLFTYTVRNTGMLNLHNVTLEDQLFGGIPGPINGSDPENDGILAPGEQWQYLSLHSADLNETGYVDNQATVFAESVTHGIQVSDLSDDDGQIQDWGQASFGSGQNGDDPTTAPYDVVCGGAFARMGLIKTASPLDQDGDGCNETIEYTFALQNVGDVAIEQITLTDDILEGVEPTLVSNGNGNAILEPDEIWDYEAQYSLTQEDLVNGIVSNQAVAIGKLVGFDLNLFDQSDDNSTDENDPTIEQTEGYCAPPDIGLIKESFGGDFLVDLDSDGCVETIHYRFVVTNTGGMDLHNLVLTDLTMMDLQISEPIESGVNDDLLSVGETWTYEAFYPLTQQDIDDGQVSNQAEVVARTVLTDVEVSDFSDHSDFDNDRETVASTLGGGICVAESGIQLTKSIGGSGFQDTNNDGCIETLVYTFVVENTGAIRLDNIILNDPNFGGQINAVPQSNIIGDNDEVLEVGETWTYQVPYLLTQADVDLGSVTNQADVLATEEGTANEVSDMDEITTPLGAGFCPALSIQLNKSVDSFQDIDGNGCNEVIRYAFIVENTGVLDLEDVVLSDNNLGGQVNEQPQGDVGNDLVLSVGEIWTYQADYPLVQDDIDTGSVTNQADVTALEPINNLQVSDQMQINTPLSANECVPLAAVQLTKSVDSFQDLDGNGCNEVIRYNFTVKNTGVFDLEQVVLSDNNLGGEINVVPQSNLDNDQVLAVGEIWTYQADYTLVQNDIDTGSVTNQASISALEPMNNLQVTDQMQINTPLSANECAPAASIHLIKTLIGPGWQDTNNDGCFETLVYTFIVENTGTFPLENVVINDPNLGGELAVQPQDDVNNDGLLSPGEQWVYEVPYFITQADMDFGSVANQAEVTAVVENTNNPVTDMDEISLLLDNNFCAARGIQLTKVGLLENLNGDNCSESIHYTFTVTNTGVVNLQQVVLTDADLTVPISGPQGDTGNDQILSIGETWTFEAFYPITQADIDGVIVDNLATVTAIEEGTNNPVTAMDNHSTNVSTACVAESSIGLIKTAANSLVDVNGDGCPESISYTFTVKNTGTIILQDVVLNDIKLGPGSINGPLPGNDINSDTFLSVGETWTYQALYPISEQDSIAGEVINQAQVSAVELNTANSVTDDSDDNSFDEDDDTITSVGGACVARAGIEFLKTAVLVDLDGDACAETIQYNFRVQNTGTINLYQIAIIDELLESTTITGPLQGNDLNNDGVLSINETWNFQAQYTITQTDIDSGFVVNQAQVEALEQISNNPVSATSNEVNTPIEDGCIDPTNPVDPNFEIFNALTPNGDGKNDFFQIDGIENYPNNVLRIFNRWGVLVYEAESYGSGSTRFNGQSQGQGTIAKERALPSGTYFYTLTFSGTNPGQKNYSGYLYISQE